MGPIALFDKSFLQSLNVDESIWFDNHYLANVSPLFYVETLADLDKAVREGRTPEQEVGIIASKFPEMHGTPNVHHGTLCTANLMGSVVSMTGQIIVPGGRPVRSANKFGVVFEKLAEVQAFERWRQGKFLEVEKLFAKGWREQLRNLDLKERTRILVDAGLDGKKCKSLSEAKTVADGFVTQRAQRRQMIKFALAVLPIPAKFHEPAISNWRSSGCLPLIDFAPYAAYALGVELFFNLAVSNGLIAAERSSNLTDIAYLFYLPFCMLFVSSDRLHRNCASLFLRPDQEFVWGEEMKDDLKLLNYYYSNLPAEVKDRGVLTFADEPPQDERFLIRRLHNKWAKKPRSLKSSEPDQALEIQDIMKIVDGEHVPGADISNPDVIAIKRSVRRRKGSWLLIPKDYKPE
jgi:hypothetical protein